jgi:DNA-binding PadR family transcriptional regulator
MANSTKQNRHLPAFLLLFLLEKPMHGGMLFSKIQESLHHVDQLDSGAIYRVLRDLESKNFVHSSWNTNDAGPAKRIYTITENGKKEAKRWYDDITLRKKNLDFFLLHYDSLANQPLSIPDESDDKG